MTRIATVAVTLATAVLCLAAPTDAAAETFYVDPENGSADGDGSQSDPWATLEQVVGDGLIATRDWASKPPDSNTSLEPKNDGAPVGAGDTLVLMSGYHGAVQIRGAYNETTITIRAGMGETPKLSHLQLRSAANWHVKGLTISPSFADEYERRTMLDVSGHGHHGPSHDITVENNEMYSVDDASGWSADDWDSKAASGIGVGADDTQVLNNTVRNTNFGISVSGENARVAHNTVDGFSGDGLRGLGDNGKFLYNVVKNAWDVNKNHDDGFQSWSRTDQGVGTGEVKGIVLRGNLFINNEDPSADLAATLQGIGCFDGFFTDWTVENNVIITNHWHGITFLGMRDSQIVNNTIIDISDGDPGPPWIQVDTHKDGTPSENVIVRNNLVTDLKLGDGVTGDHNIELSDPSAHFVDPDNFDLHLKKDSSAIDAGSAMGAPSLDRDEVPRPQGDGIDIGAYEWYAGDTPPGADTGGGDAGADGGMDAAMGDGDTGGDVTGDTSSTMEDTTEGSDDTGGAPDTDPVADTAQGGGSDGGGSNEASGGVDKSEEGCGCSAAPGTGGRLPSLAIFGLLLLAIRRRMRR